MAGTLSWSILAILKHDARCVSTPLAASCPLTSPPPPPPPPSAPHPPFLLASVAPVLNSRSHYTGTGRLVCIKNRGKQNTMWREHAPLLVGGILCKNYIHFFLFFLSWNGLTGSFCFVVIVIDLSDNTGYQQHPVVKETQLKFSSRVSWLKGPWCNELEFFVSIWDWERGWKQNTNGGWWWSTTCAVAVMIVLLVLPDLLLYLVLSCFLSLVWLKDRNTLWKRGWFGQVNWKGSVLVMWPRPKGV